MTAAELIVHTFSIVAILYAVKLIGWTLFGVVRDWWRGRSRDLSDLVADNMARRDVYAEDVMAHEPCALCRLSERAVFADFEAMAKRNRDVIRSSRALAGLYLIPPEGAT